MPRVAKAAVSRVAHNRRQNTQFSSPTGAPPQQSGVARNNANTTENDDGQEPRGNATSAFHHHQPPLRGTTQHQHQQQQHPFVNRTSLLLLPSNGFGDANTDMENDDDVVTDDRGAVIRHRSSMEADGDEEGHAGSKKSAMFNERMQTRAMLPRASATTLAAVESSLTLGNNAKRSTTTSIGRKAATTVPLPGQHPSAATTKWRRKPQKNGVEMAANRSGEMLDDGDDDDDGDSADVEHGEEECYPASEDQPDAMPPTSARARLFAEDAIIADDRPPTELFGQLYTFNLTASSLFLWTPDSALRRWLFFLIDDPRTERVILVVILYSLAIMCLSTPGLSTLPGAPTTILVSEIILQIFFSLEAVAKIIALGFFAHPYSYLRSGWNVVDILIVIFGFVAFPGPDSFRKVRLLRVFRLLRQLKTFETTNAVVVALQRSAFKMGDVVLLILFAVTAFSVMGVQLFKGALDQRCYFNIVTPTEQNVTLANGRIVTTLVNVTQNVIDPQDPWVCSLNPNSGHQCLHGSACQRHLDVFHTPFLNYDNIGNAIYYVGKFFSQDNWPGDCNLVQQAQGASFFLYAMITCYVGSFFCMNLFVATLTTAYGEVMDELKEERAKKIAVVGTLDAVGVPTSALAEAAKESTTTAGAAGGVDGADADEMLDSDEEVDAAAREGAGAEAEYEAVEEGADSANEPTSRRNKDAAPTLFQQFRAYLREILWSQYFNNLSLFMTFLNVTALAVDHFGIEPVFSKVLDTINLICTIFFLTELFFKIVAKGLAYFKDPFNDFDCIICLASIPELVLGSGGGGTFNALRAFRLMRIVRVSARSPTLRQLMLTVARATVSSAAIFALLLTWLLILALFTTGFLSDSIPADQRPNHTNLWNAYILWFIVITGENWIEIANNTMLGSNTAPGYLFWFAYIVGNYILLNFVIAILIDSFTESAEQAREEIDAEKATEAQQLDSLAPPVADGGEDGDAPRPGSGVDDTSSGASDQNRPSSAVVPAPADAAGKPTTAAGGADDAVRSMTPAGDGGVPSPAVAAKPTGTANHPRPSGGGTPSSADRDVVVVLAAAATATAVLNSNGNNGESSVDRVGVTSSNTRSMGGGESAIVDIAAPVDAAAAASGSGDIAGHSDNDDDALLAHVEYRSFSLVRFLLKWFGTEDRSPDLIASQLTGESLYLFPPDHPVRVAIARIVTHPYYELAVLLIIAESCISLFFDNWSAREAYGEDSIDRFISINTIFLAFFFFIETSLNVIAFGFVSEPISYLRSGWNVLELFVLVMSVLDIFLPYVNAFRSLRIFRFAKKTASLRVVFDALAAALPGLGNVLLVIVFFFLVFGILGVQLMMGSFVFCTDSSVTDRVNCTGDFDTLNPVIIQNATGVFQFNQTVTAPRQWQFMFYNFNHLGVAMLTLFQQLINDGWSVQLFNGMDAVSYDTAMTFDYNPAMALFFMAFIVVGNFFLYQLFVGSLINSFAAERDKSRGVCDGEGRRLLTPEQEHWLRSYRIASATALIPHVPKPEFPLRQFACWVYFADSGRHQPRMVWDEGITICILINVAFMCSDYADQPAYWDTALFGINVGFSIVYTIEAIVKMTALLPTVYFSDSWTRFDFLLVPVSYISLFVGGPGTNALRVMRVARALRLVKRAKGLHRLFNSLIYALPQLINVFVFILIVFFFFAVTATVMFQNLPVDNWNNFPLNEFFNFRDPVSSMMVFMQIVTTESWEDAIRAACMTPDNSDCTYEQNNCGNPYVAIPLFVIFMTVGNCVSINLFTFVIVDNYMQIEDLENDHSRSLFAKLLDFRTQWSVLDKTADGVLRWESFVLILRRVLATRYVNSGRDDDTGNAVMYGEKLEGKKLATEEAALRADLAVRASRAKRQEEEELADVQQQRKSLSSSNDLLLRDHSGLIDADVDDGDDSSRRRRRRHSSQKPATVVVAGSVVDDETLFGREHSSIEMRPESSLRDAPHNSGDRQRSEQNVDAIMTTEKRDGGSSSLLGRPVTRGDGSMDLTVLAARVGAVEGDDVAQPPLASAPSPQTQQTSSAQHPSPRSLAAAPQANNDNNTDVNSKNEEEVLVRSARQFAAILKQNSDFEFMKQLREMQIPVGAGGLVRYDDAIFGICKMHYNVDEDGAKVAARFVDRDVDHAQLDGCFMVHHAFAVRKIVRIIRRTMRRKRLNRQQQANLGVVTSSSLPLDVDLPD